MPSAAAHAAGLKRFAIGGVSATGTVRHDGDRVRTLMTRHDAVVGTLQDYYAAFNTLEVGAVLPYFHQPSLLLGAQGAFAAPTADALTIAVSAVIYSLRGRGFGRSELIVRRVEFLSAGISVVSGIAVRYKVDGEELERVGVTYVLHRVDGRWKIAVLIVHDPIDAALAESERQAV